jgi:hypothetical protein
MTTLYVPVVKDETAITKNFRMISFISITIIITLIIMNHVLEYHVNICIPPMPPTMESFKSDCINQNSKNIPILAKYIVLKNLNKKKIPVMQILYITDANIIKYIPIQNAKQKYINKGVNIQFELPKETKIKQIIIDIDEFSKWLPNINTTRVELRDINNFKVWSNCKPLYSDKKYIDLHIVNQNIIYPVIAQKLPERLSTNSDGSQENVLNYVLQENSWD